MGQGSKKDMIEDKSGAYKHLIGVPKPLLPVGGVPVLSHWLEILNSTGCFAANGSDYFLVTNALHHHLYLQWAKKNNFPTQNIFNDGTRSNESRLGAIRDIFLLIEEKNIHDDFIVIGGDTLFTVDFNLNSILATFRGKKQSIVLSYIVQDTTKYGIIEVSSENVVTSFLEKPSLAATKSRTACPCFYVFRKSVISFLQEYTKSATSLQQVDAPGTFLAWLYQRSPLYAIPVGARFDIGSLATYIEADEYITRHKNRSHSSSRALGLFLVVTLVVVVLFRMKKGN